MEFDTKKDRLSLLLNVSEILASPSSLAVALELMVMEVIETFGAQRGFVLSLEQGQLQPRAVHHKDPENAIDPYLYSTTIVGHVLESGESLLSLDAPGDGRFRAPSITLQGIRSVMCVPMRWGGTVRGVVYVDNALRAGIFRESDLKTLEAIAGQTSKSLETAALQDELEKVRSIYLQQMEQNLQSKDFNLEKSESLAGQNALDLLLGNTSGQVIPAVPALQRSEAPKFYLFGPFRVHLPELLVNDWSSRKQRELIAFLACHRHRIITQEELMELFWPKGGQKAKHSLHNSITQIRRKLKDSTRELVQQKHDGYTLGPECWVDVEGFGKAFQAGRESAGRGHWEQALIELQEAEQLGQAEFMQGCFSDWILEQRAQLQSQLNDCRNLLAEYFGLRGTHVLAIELWKRVLQHDRCYEAAYRGLLQAYRALGRQAEAARTYQGCVLAFREELDLPPPEDLEGLL